MYATIIIETHSTIKTRRIRRVVRNIFIVLLQKGKKVKYKKLNDIY